MAIDIRKLGTRALSALVFVIVLLGCILFSYWTFTLLFLIISIWGLHEFYKIAERQGLRPYRAAGMLVAVFLYLTFISVPFTHGLNLWGIRLAAMFTVLVLCIFDRGDQPFTNGIWTFFGLGYTVLPVASLHLAVNNHLEYEPGFLLGILLLIWCNDTFAYLGGSMVGNRKMIERVSPGKTWEGTIIGMLCTIGGSYFLSLHLIPQSAWLVSGIAVPLLATAGDLFESTMKRQAGIKDTGSIMPGHGGILDRFDSLIFVSPFLAMYCSLQPH